MEEIKEKEKKEKWIRKMKKYIICPYCNKKISFLEYYYDKISDGFCCPECHKTIVMDLSGVVKLFKRKDNRKS